jgi:hypothetical protein
MRKSMRRLTALAVLSLIAALLGVAVPGVASATGSQFTLVDTSGRAGMMFRFSQNDPCPASIQGPYNVKVTFTDAADTRVGYVSIPLNPDGTWTRSDSIVVPTDAAIGVGTVQAWCVEDVFDPFHPNGNTTLTYESQSYEVTDTAAHIGGLQPTYAFGDEFHAESSTLCVGATGFSWQMQNEGSMSPVTMREGLAFAVRDDDTNAGAWDLDGTIPTQYNDGGQMVDFPEGTYSLFVDCELSNGRYLQYAKAYFSVVKPVDVALGDSYSAGLGTSNYDSLSGGCYRSEDSYVYYVADQKALGAPRFAACSGAQTDDFYDANPNNTNEPAQLSQLVTGEVRTITLTIGGNDAGFADVLGQCAERLWLPGQPTFVGYGCASDSTLNGDLSQRLDALAGTTTGAYDSRPIHPLASLYQAMAEDAPDAKIYVGGYPRLFGTDKDDYTVSSGAPGGAFCDISPGSPVPVSISYDDAQWLNAKADGLNSTIETAVEDAQGEGVDITFVPADNFSGHGLCDAQSAWINHVSLDSSNNPLPESFHPTVTGYENGYGAAFVAAMS